MSSKKRHDRRAAREAAVKLLYSGDITDLDAAGILEAGGYPGDLDLNGYAERLIKGTVAHIYEIDARLAAVSENWTVERMPIVDRAILRLAVYEMLFVDEIPIPVAINEAVDLARAYGGEDDSSRFVNGVLGCIARAEEGDTSDERQ